MFFILGVISIVFFDHDVKDAVSDHRMFAFVADFHLYQFSLNFTAEGVHKSLLVHRIYELFIHLGLSDHKASSIILIYRFRCICILH